MSFRVGCSGWSYPHWRGRFYPKGLRQTDWFGHYASLFDTVEINNSFYRTPTEDTYLSWSRRSPAGFLYSVKVNRAITQYHRLGTGAWPLFDEFVRRAQLLGGLLGPLLLQLPPTLGRDDERLSAFLSRQVAAQHRMAVEFRRADWFEEEVYSLLRQHRVALVVSDLKNLPVARVATAPWVYARFHGPSGEYRGSYCDDELRTWADHLKALGSAGFVYFNNDLDAAAPQNALRLRELLAG